MRNHRAKGNLSLDRWRCHHVSPEVCLDIEYPQLSWTIRTLHFSTKMAMLGARTPYFFTWTSELRPCLSLGRAFQLPQCFGAVVWTGTPCLKYWCMVGGEETMSYLDAMRTSSKLMAMNTWQAAFSVSSCKLWMWIPGWTGLATSDTNGNNWIASGNYKVRSS